MQHFFSLTAACVASVSCLSRLAGLSLLLALLLPGAVRAQAPAWADVATATSAQPGSVARAMATDARGNVFVTGNFIGTVAFGSTVLTSAGGNDLFVAKYVSATGTWAWAQRGGGTAEDRGTGIAVSGSNVYVAGFINNNAANAQGVLFGGAVPVNGASGTSSNDLLVAKYTDNGTSATLGWAQVGGGTGADQGFGIAASGSNLYVTGVIFNNAANDNGVLFGGSVPVNGASGNASGDLVLAKYTDNGTSATLRWAQVGGGTGADQGFGIAASGSSVYVTGFIDNSIANTQGVLFGGAVPVNGASGTSSFDLVLAKYTDNGTSATLRWAQVGGGANNDQGTSLAVNGSSVYVTGSIFNNAANASGVLFGGAGTTPGTVPVNGASSTSSFDLLVAKYTDNGASASLGWTQVGGGTGADIGLGIATSGSSLYVAGFINNNAANANGVLFGGAGTTPGTVPVNGASGTSSQDLLVAKYTDNGASARLGWTQVGGGTGEDRALGIALSGQNVLTAGLITPSASFGSFTIASPVGGTTAVLARLEDNTLTPLPVRAGGGGTSSLTLAPNPARATTLFGAQAGASLQVFDALGRLVSTATAGADGTARLVLPAHMPAGVYVVRSGAQAVRLAVE